MSVRAKVWSMIVLVCLLLTLWQVANLRTVWREYKTIKLLQEGGGPQLTGTALIDSEAARADSEASDIFEYLIREPDVNELTALVLKYPDNEFFVFELSTKLLDAHSINPLAALVLADKLISMNPENAHYHYLKAHILLGLRNQGTLDEAIRELEKGNASPEFEYAYAKFKKRVASLVKETGASTFHSIVFEPHEAWLYFQLSRSLGHPIRSVIKTSDRNSFIELAGIASGVGEKLLQHAHRQEDLMAGSLFIRPISGLKLVDTNLFPQQAEQLRFQYARAKAVMDILGEINNVTFAGLEKIQLAAASSAIALTLFIYTGVFWLLVFVLALIRKRSKHVKLGFKAYLQYCASFIYYLALVGWLNYDPDMAPVFFHLDAMHRETSNLYLYLLILPPLIWVMFRLMVLLPPCNKKNVYRFSRGKAIVCAAIWAAILIMELVLAFKYKDSWLWILCRQVYFLVVCALLWAISVYGWFLIRLVPYRRLTENRAVQLLLFVTSVAGLNQLFIHINWVRWLPTLLLIPGSAIIIAHNSSGKVPVLLDALFNCFGKGEKIADTRTKILCLIAPYIAVFWLLFLFATSSVAPLSENLKTLMADPLAKYKQLPQANKSTYDSMVKRIDFRNVDNSSLRGAMNRSNAFSYLPLLGPQDLPAVLAKARKADPPLSERGLLDLMERCAPDVYDIILGSLEHPESKQALLARARAGDATVRSKLERVFEKQQSELTGIRPVINRPGRSRSNWYDRTFGDCLDIASAMAAISEPNEAMQRFMHTLENADLSRLQSDDSLSISYYFYKYLDSLPPRQATEVLKAYVKKTGYFDLSSRRHSSDLEDALTAFADTELAEEVFVRTCKTALILKPLDLDTDIKGLPIGIEESLSKPYDAAPSLRKAISPYFVKSSIPLLKRELHSDNANLRAYVVWQLTTLGYEWFEDELEEMLKDEGWKVRLNVLFALDRQAIEALPQDKNPVARLLARLLVESI